MTQHMILFTSLEGILLDQHEFSERAEAIGDIYHIGR